MSMRPDRSRGALATALIVVVATAAGAGPASAPVEDIRDIRAPRADAPEWLLPMVVATVVLLAILGYLLWRRRRRSLAPLSPLAHAERRLEAIRRLMTPADAPRFAVEVSAVVREYIEQRFGVGATLLTSEEFMRRLLASTDPTLVRQRGRLLEFLRQCDIAKFAGRAPTLESMQTLHAEAYRFVQETAGREETDDALPAT